MAVIKVACPDCGQRFSGDETFFGRVVDCQVCGAKVAFPKGPEEVDSENMRLKQWGWIWMGWRKL